MKSASWAVNVKQAHPADRLPRHQASVVFASLVAGRDRRRLMLDVGAIIKENPMANFGVFTRNYRQHISTSGTGGVFAPVLEKKVLEKRVRLDLFR